MSQRAFAAPGFEDGSRFAHYRIEQHIASGGMGEVYKAYDTRLDRTVALKILRPELLRDPERVRRFEQEARAASALNHPAVVTIYEVGEESSINYIAMEFLDGESLRQKLRQSPSVTKMLELVERVAEALSTVHAGGVVHRDLKPDNIMVTAHGPKIVDFGLAKLTQPDILFSRGANDGPTISIRPSPESVLIGTVGYMSPEQIEGRRVDHRSDIFSLGCILYEVITGRRVFHSTSVVETLHQITSAEPIAIEEVNPAAPPELSRIVARCLSKDPDERYQSMKEVAIELRQFRRSYDQPETRRARRRSRLRPYWYAAVIATILSVAIAVIALATRPHTFDQSKFRFIPLATGSAYEGFPSWSADGRSIAYVSDVNGIFQVFVRPIESSVGRQITQSSRDCREPFWDPSGNHIYYISVAEERDALWSVGAAGGSPEVVLPNVQSAAISPDGKSLAFLREMHGQGNFLMALWTSSPVGAEPRLYTQAPLGDRRFAAGMVRFAPDNSKIAVYGATRKANDRPDRQFWIVPYPTGEPYQVLKGLSKSPRADAFAWMADSRKIVLGTNHVSAAGMHLWIGDTVTGDLRPLTTGTGNESHPAVSPDGRRIVFGTEEADFDLVSLPIGEGTPATLLASSRNEQDPAWSPVKNEYAYVTNRTGTDEIWLRSQDGQWERPVVTSRDFRGDPTFFLSGVSFSPDGARIAYQRRGHLNFRIWISPAAGGSAVPLIPDDQYAPGQHATFEEGSFEDAPTWSPDGTWIAYVHTVRSGTFSLAKMKVGTESSPIVLKPEVIYPSNPQWSPRGDWITMESREGLSVISPNGATTRLLSEETWLAHAWSRDGSLIYGIKLDEDFHLLLRAIHVSTGEEKPLADLGPSAPTVTPLNGFSLAPDGKSIATSIPKLKGDLWLLEGFDDRRTLLQRLLSR